MKKLFLIPLWLFMMVSLLTPSLANADAKKWVFQPRLTTGLIHYDFEYTFTAPDANPSKFQLIDNMPFIGGGAMLAYDRCFVDSYFQVSTTGKDGGELRHERNHVQSPIATIISILSNPHSLKTVKII